MIISSGKKSFLFRIGFIIQWREKLLFILAQIEVYTVIHTCILLHMEKVSHCFFSIKATTKNLPPENITEKCGKNTDI